MNSYILMAEITQAPQLRYTQENQTAIAEFVVKFPGARPEDPPSQLKVIGWGNLAQEIQQGYHVGDRVLLEGRLGMNTVERSDGVKEKRAEMTVQRIHSLGSLGSMEIGTATEMPAATYTPTSATPAVTPRPSSAPVSPSQTFSAPPQEEPDYDDIPF